MQQRREVAAGGTTDAWAVSGWGDDPEGRLAPVDVGRFYPNRHLFRTRHRPQMRVLRRPVRRAKGTTRAHRARRSVRACAASRDGPDEPEPPGLTVTWIAALRRELLRGLGGAV
jgi:hypothetical protein